MNDSINLIIKCELEIARLISLGIKYRPLSYMETKSGKAYLEYGKAKAEKDAELKSTGVGFIYKDMYFKYYKQFHCLIITTTSHKVLGKKDILLSDRDKYISKVCKAVAYILGISDPETLISNVVNVRYQQLKVHRFDYCVDLKLENDVISEYLQLLDKHRNSYGNIKAVNEYETSRYLTSKCGQKTINIYDKYHCELDKYLKAYLKQYHKTGISEMEYNQKHPHEYDKYKNIFRIEVQNSKVLIKNASKELEKQCKGDDNEIVPELLEKLLKEIYAQDTTDKQMTLHQREKSIYAYWSKESMYKHFFEYLKDYLYTGKYYKLDKAIDMINETDQLTKSEKPRLIEFITAVRERGISSVTKSNNAVDHKMWCGATVNTYLNILQTLGINIVKIDGRKSCDLKSIMSIIDESSYSDNWKSKLKEFVSTANEYGVENTIAKNNKQIVSKVKNDEQRVWCKATVDKYIEKLSLIGINPVTLDNDSKFESLESLYTLAKEKAENEYFDIDTIDIPKINIPITRESIRRNGNCNVW